MGIFQFFEGLTGKSLGKSITKTKIVTKLGEVAEFKTIFLRSLFRNISFNNLSFLSSIEFGCHDRFSKTRVVLVD
ncbi:MAG TPA: hypothetical protein ENH87_13560 [Pricia antarctica]|uniref:RDD domain-containing protein n=1 Tax=Pricia antarctica TaxID=641691 RepID=A0A831QRF4_9FLAO|nr:hypothetical protein [Pricia antarctica]